ncbi:hypothetical protein KJ742_07100, partial [Patescibacteria group bacterium]|nr:hypothetical protein [Patescibacteria group bacterium]
SFLFLYIDNVFMASVLNSKGNVDRSFGEKSFCKKAYFLRELDEKYPPVYYHYDVENNEISNLWPLSPGSRLGYLSMIRDFLFMLIKEYDEDFDKIYSYFEGYLKAKQIDPKAFEQGLRDFVERKDSKNYYLDKKWEDFVFYVLNQQAIAGDIKTVNFIENFGREIGLLIGGLYLRYKGNDFLNNIYVSGKVGNGLGSDFVSSIEKGIEEAGMFFDLHKDLTDEKINQIIEELNKTVSVNPVYLEYKRKLNILKHNHWDKYQKYKKILDCLAGEFLKPEYKFYLSLKYCAEKEGDILNLIKELFDKIKKSDDFEIDEVYFNIKSHFKSRSINGLIYKNQLLRQSA